MTGAKGESARARDRHIWVLIADAPFLIWSNISFTQSLNPTFNHPYPPSSLPGSASGTCPLSPRPEVSYRPCITLSSALYNHRPCPLLPNPSLLSGPHHIHFPPLSVWRV